MLREAMQINTPLSYPAANFPNAFFGSADDARSAERLTHSDRQSPEWSTSEEPPTVLLVDDNQSVLAGAKAALSARCLVLGTVRDGPAALVAAAVLRPAVIV